jgi:RimJ/RimL family protein N-acetyltransferase
VIDALPDVLGAAPPFLVGERLILRQLAESDVDGPYARWFNDAEVCAGNSHHVFPYTREQALAYVRRLAEARDALVLAMVERDGGRHVGNISLQDIHPIYRSAELAIVIGEKEAWGRGYGREAGELIVEHGFAELNLHRVGCATFEDNHGMQALARALGMSEEGRRRQAAFKRGRHLDVVEYGVLRHEWHARRIEED